ncbi:formamidopyrimidine/5-formyluracil/ 5-hydroxymethyluracil DNA glycosylase [Mycobacterium tuberculosis CAS/NITR204]|uniref:Formamidopyrimidine/5-formyluracil/ 5-hydroxymethyluracil DNA glycosylase n=1 Tax=Mycobacterium tuberculosis CAS/NITR204 TaxID=1310114 RepID=R4MHF8_MYCTX|nr:formamidopyrimidine/5-formyluracil/ 5-hydroxymethyluracil DNA glycosylase [Mycobacterium tuberculosis CAS/NITR204]
MVMTRCARLRRACDHHWMPELPEVEVVRRGLQAHVTGRTITEVRVHHPRAGAATMPGPRI